MNVLLAKVHREVQIVVADDLIGPRAQHVDVHAMYVRVGHVLPDQRASRQVELEVLFVLFVLDAAIEDTVRVDEAVRQDPFFKSVDRRAVRRKEALDHLRARLAELARRHQVGALEPHLVVAELQLGALRWDRDREFAGRPRVLGVISSGLCSSSVLDFNSFKGRILTVF